VAGSAWTNQIVSLIILSAALEGFSGLFSYSPAVGAGNLAASIAPVAGEDPYGDQYLAGLAAYGATFAAALAAGFVSFYAGSLAGGWTEEATIQGDGLGNLILAALNTIQLTSVTEANSDLIVDGTLFVGGASGGSLTAQNFNMNPRMGTPPNLGAINGGTATAAQICAFLSTWYSEFQNRGMAN
jgi:hypothetical protein